MLQRFLLSAALALPLSDSKKWIQVEFDKIAKNSVTYGEKLKTKVSSSHSPLVYSFGKVVQISKIYVKAKNTSLLQLHEGANQFSLENDDFLLKIGLVVPGKTRVKGVARWFAADWILKLQDKAPKGLGMDYIQFYNVVQSQDLLGQERIHPKSDFFHEKNVYVQSTVGDFSFSVDLPRPLPAYALWLGSDGDDTQSNFQIEIQSLQLELKNWTRLEPGSDSK